jgi:hypothetical protein
LPFAYPFRGLTPRFGRSLLLPLIRFINEARAKHQIGTESCGHR